MSAPFIIRPITPEDTPAIVSHRRAMFEDMGYSGPNVDAMETEFRLWLASKLYQGKYLGWFATTAEGEVVAGLGLWLLDWPPGPLDITDQRGYILNVYTHPAYRRHGLARRLMLHAMDWCQQQGLHTVLLHASNDGRALYESLGFQQSNEMRMQLA